MLSTVLRPSTERGTTSSTGRSAAARTASASADTATPAAIAPPRNSPRADTASTVVDVPKVTTTHGPPWRS